MWGKKASGLIGIVIGSIWLVVNLQHVSNQGFVAIGMPLILLILGIIYFRKA